MAKLNKWEQKFYWIGSKELADNPKADDRHLLRHSELKWRGLRAGNVQLFGYMRSSYGPETYESMCYRYELKARNTPKPCAQCPVYKFRKGVSCREPASNELISPWARYVSRRDPMNPPDPEGMIQLMRDTYDWLTKKKTNWEP